LSERRKKLVQFIFALVLVVLFLLIAVWDTFCTFIGSPNQTVSALFNSWAHEFPPFTLLIGFLLGHLFWPVQQIARP